MISKVKEQTLEQIAHGALTIIIKDTDQVSLIRTYEPDDELHPQYKVLVVMPWCQLYKLFESNDKVKAQVEFEKASNRLKHGKGAYGIRIINPSYAEVVEIPPK